MNATDLNRAPANKLNRGLNADSFRMVFPKNYVELPLGQTVWVDGTGDWFNPLNWSAGVPNSGTIAQINNGGTAEITLGGAAASQVELGIAAGDAGTLSTSGSGSLQDEGAMYVGEQGTGTLSITAGASISSSLFALGQSPGSSGVETPCVIKIGCAVESAKRNDFPADRIVGHCKVRTRRRRLVWRQLNPIRKTGLSSRCSRCRSDRNAALNNDYRRIRKYRAWVSFIEHDLTRSIGTVSTCGV